MRITVTSFAAYLTRVADGLDWRSEDWTANKIVKAIKGEPFKGYADVPIDGRVRRFDGSNPQVAVDWFVQRVRSHLEPMAPLVLVPVPNKAGVVGSPFEFATARLAQRISERMGASVVAHDLLRWSGRFTPAHDGGPRTEDDLYSKLRVVRKPLPGYRHVLLDDVYTTGAHVRACARRLEKAGTNVSHAFAAARATSEQEPDVFAVRETTLTDLARTWR